MLFLKWVTPMDQELQRTRSLLPDTKFFLVTFLSQWMKANLSNSSPEKPRGTTFMQPVTNGHSSQNKEPANLWRPYFFIRSMVKLHIAKDKRTGRSRGFAYLDFDNKDSAEEAVTSLTGKSPSAPFWDSYFIVPQPHRTECRWWS